MFVSMFVLMYVVEVFDMDVEDLFWFVDNMVNKWLLLVYGVVKVMCQGGVDCEVCVQFDFVCLQVLNVLVVDISV